VDDGMNKMRGSRKARERGGDWIECCHHHVERSEASE